MGNFSTIIHFFCGGDLFISVPVVLEARPPGTPNGVARGVGHRKTHLSPAVGVADSDWNSWGLVRINDGLMMANGTLIGFNDG